MGPPISSVYAAIDTTVPMTNMVMNEIAAALVGSASAGMTTNRASGCRPCTMPVAYVAKPARLLVLEGSDPPSASVAHEKEKGRI